MHIANLTFPGVQADEPSNIALERSMMVPVGADKSAIANRAPLGQKIEFHISLFSKRSISMDAESLTFY